MNFHERKKERTERYFKEVFGHRVRPCSACAGSGRYDHNGSPPCSSCLGTGKELYNPKDEYEARRIEESIDKAVAAYLDGKEGEFKHWIRAMHRDDYDRVRRTIMTHHGERLDDFYR